MIYLDREDNNDCLNEKNIDDQSVYDYDRSDDHDRLHNKCLMKRSIFLFEFGVELVLDWDYKNSLEMCLGVLHLEQAFCPAFQGTYPPFLRHFELF